MSPTLSRPSDLQRKLLNHALARHGEHVIQACQKLAFQNRYLCPEQVHTCDLTTDELLADCADRAERLRRQGAEVVLVTGAELSLFTVGFLPGDSFTDRIDLLTALHPHRRELLAEVSARINDVLGKAWMSSASGSAGRSATPRYRTWKASRCIPCGTPQNNRGMLCHGRRRGEKRGAHLSHRAIFRAGSSVRWRAAHAPSRSAVAARS